MLSVHSTNFKGSKELLRILRLHCQRNGIPREICSDGSSIFMSNETQDFFKRYNMYLSGTGCLNSDAVTQALLAHAETPCKTLKLSPAQLAYGRTLKYFFPRNVESLIPITKNLLSAEAKEQRQSKIRAEAGRRLDEHTKVLPELEVGDHVQFKT